MNKKLKILISLIVIVAGVVGTAYLVVPKPQLLENFSFSTGIYDRNGELLRLSLSDDDKYRLYVPIEKIPENAKKALLLYEDNYFYYHMGVDPFAILRAFFNNFTPARKQGASTITMQLARLAFNLETNTVTGKIYQMVKAMQIEMFYSKNEILEAYFNLAPYGYNIEGIGAASLIYFGQDIEKLSLPEILSLIVIPQNPVNRNPIVSFKETKKAYDRLGKLWEEKYPNDISNPYLNMPIKVRKIQDLPFIAPHFTTGLLQKYSGRVETTIDKQKQKGVERIVTNYIARKKSLGINNAAVLLIDYKTMEVVAHVGSADFYNAKILGQVDGTKAQRSPGSALKPFIYGQAIEKGIIHPMTMLKDLPKNYGFYTPENFDRSFMGIMSATNALIYSRNIPAVELLLQLETTPFYELLQNSGVRNLKNEDFYGLALALGGFEISLYEAVGMYAMLANLGDKKDIISVTNKYKKENEEKKLLSPEAAFLTLQMLGKNRPVDKIDLPVETVDDNNPVYWKTGTSYGFKDAWTVGIFGQYVLGIWVGNFDGTPNHAFVGRDAAAPLFFEIARNLEKSNNFSREKINHENIDVSIVDICKNTGDIANGLCPEKIPSWFIPGVSPIKMSNVHRQIPIDIKTGLRACFHNPPETKLQVFEFWPSDIKNAFTVAGVYKELPPDFKENCNTFKRKGKAPQIIYPVANIRYIVRYHELQTKKIPLKASTDADVDYIYWFLDNALVGKTIPNEIYEMPAKIGSFTIKAVDNLGRESFRNIEILVKD